MSNSQGKIVVNADEWTLSDRGFQKAPDAATLAINLAKYFVGNEKGKFHVLSNNWGLTESSLEETMIKSGHTWTKGMNIQINIATLSQYDGIFIGGDPIDNQVLIEYVKNGGKVYLGAATSEVGAEIEANNWNTFLAAFGLKLEKLDDSVSEKAAVNKSHPLFSGVKTLYQDRDMQIIDLQPDSPLNQIILTNSNGQGLMATAEFIKVPVPKPLNGRIVVNADEWTFSDRGFQKAPHTATFAINLAKYFVGDEKGKFHVLSNNWGLMESSLEETMTRFGHTWTKGMTIPINIATLSQYDGIFIGGDPIDNQVLIEYVKNGGKVYLWAGTGQGGSEIEANNWNTFLAAFGLKLEKSHNTVSENLVVNKNDPLFSGVKTLYQDRGIYIIDLQRYSSLNQIILTNINGQGLMATAEFIKTPVPQTAIETTPAIEPTVDVTPAPEPAIESLVSDSEEFTITATQDVTISKLVYKGEVKRTQSDEYIEISNLGNSSANISGWKITSGGSLKQFFTFPEGTILEGGKSFRVYTNEVHPETGGFSYGSKSAVWNDAGDEAKLFDAAGNNVSTLAYGKNTVAGITQEFKVSQLKFVASYGVINKQMALGGTVTFTEALSLAIRSFLEDDSNVKSPLALILKDPVAFGLSSRATKAMATEKLRSFMNENGTLSLLPTAKRSTGENGETVEKNWIFELSLGAFGETTFYTVVPR
ncbi:lamin tail domain-containing protein [Floridanema evergladense]|uniref:Lamin tail domain-containing protein n=1 Tax=Floridaenema evergladense BLCC-F167 TaxID=3153639 RepID=A0ABV4WW90_9CYAN